MSIGIYKIKNLINGKLYIGQSVNIEQRWRFHIMELRNNRHHSSYLQNAWNKYGDDNFEFSIIEECRIDQLDIREMYWIDKFDSYKNGYNLTIGGSNTESFSKSIIQFDCAGNELHRYSSISEAVTSTGVCGSQISACCLHKRKTAGGYIWQYEEGFTNIPQWHFDARMFKQINQLTKDGELINVFPSSAEAKRITGICDTSIIRCCYGKLKTAGGYVWSFT